MLEKTKLLNLTTSWRFDRSILTQHSVSRHHCARYYVKVLMYTMKIEIDKRSERKQIFYDFCKKTNYYFMNNICYIHNE